jgi:hypothetical protein
MPKAIFIFQSRMRRVLNPAMDIVWHQNAEYAAGIEITNSWDFALSCASENKVSLILCDPTVDDADGDELPQEEAERRIRAIKAKSPKTAIYICGSGSPLRDSVEGEIDIGKVSTSYLATLILCGTEMTGPDDFKNRLKVATTPPRKRKARTPKQTLVAQTA